MEYIEFNGNSYPYWQAQGNAARWIMPLATEVCKGTGYDIGYSKEAWMMPGAIGIEPSIDPAYDAMRLPADKVDYIFSSHCLEHVKENWPNVLDYWLSKIRARGVLFLYLPHVSQEYWHPENNRKHVHKFEGPEVVAYLRKYCEVYLTPVDYNNSFAVIARKG